MKPTPPQLAGTALLGLLWLLGGWVVYTSSLPEIAEQLPAHREVGLALAAYGAGSFLMLFVGAPALVLMAVAMVVLAGSVVLRALETPTVEWGMPEVEMVIIGALFLAFAAFELFEFRKRQRRA